MEIIVSELKTLEELDVIDSLAPTMGKAKRELASYREKYFDTHGKPPNPTTGQPDTILIAKQDDTIIGYLHWWTNCWDNDEVQIIATGIDLSLSLREIGQVAKALTKGFKDWKSLQNGW